MPLLPENIPASMPAAAKAVQDEASLPSELFLTTPDPDAPEEEMAVLAPAGWNRQSAEAFARLILDHGRIEPGSRADFFQEASGWLHALKGLDPDLKKHLLVLLLEQKMTPQGIFDPAAARSGSILRLSGFVSDGEFQAADFAQAILTARKFADFLEKGKSGQTGQADIPALRLTDLDAALALMGEDYATAQGRESARLITAFTRMACEFPGAEPDVLKNLPVPKSWSRLLQFSESMPKGRDFPGVPLKVTFSQPDDLDALLGTESCGLAPLFSPVTAQGTLQPSVRARLANQGITLEKALAGALEGKNPVPLADGDAHRAMHETLQGICAFLPPLPDWEIRGQFQKLEEKSRKFFQHSAHPCPEALPDRSGETLFPNA